MTRRVSHLLLAALLLALPGCEAAPLPPQTDPPTAEADAAAPLDAPAATDTPVEGEVVGDTSLDPDAMRRPEMDAQTDANPDATADGDAVATNDGGADGTTLEDADAAAEVDAATSADAADGTTRSDAVPLTDAPADSAAATDTETDLGPDGAADVNPDPNDATSDGDPAAEACSGIPLPSCMYEEGVCKPDGAICLGGALGWKCGPTEEAGHYEGEETRCDGRDNDCDGATDAFYWPHKDLNAKCAACHQAPGVLFDGLDTAPNGSAVTGWRVGPQFATFWNDQPWVLVFLEGMGSQVILRSATSSLPLTPEHHPHGPPAIAGSYDAGVNMAVAQGLPADGYWVNTYSLVSGPTPWIGGSFYALGGGTSSDTDIVLRLDSGNLGQVVGYVDESSSTRVDLDQYGFIESLVVAPYPLHQGRLAVNLFSEMRWATIHEGVLTYGDVSGAVASHGVAPSSQDARDLHLVVDFDEATHLVYRDHGEGEIVYHRLGASGALEHTVTFPGTAATVARGTDGFVYVAYAAPGGQVALHRFGQGQSQALGSFGPPLAAPSGIHLDIPMLDVYRLIVADGATNPVIRVFAACPAFP